MRRRGRRKRRARPQDDAGSGDRIGSAWQGLRGRNCRSGLLQHSPRCSRDQGCLPAPLRGFALDLAPAGADTIMAAVGSTHEATGTRMRQRLPLGSRSHEATSSRSGASLNEATRGPLRRRPEPRRGRAPGRRHAQNVLPLIREVQAAGARTLAEITAALNARGVETARGGSWAAMTVKRILDRAG